VNDQDTAQSEGASSRPEAASLEFRDAVKHYPGAEGNAVDHLSFEVPAGEICVLVGPSGCGKTTAMRMVNRMIEITGGDILLGGHSVRDADQTQLRREIGYVIQQIGLFPHQTVADNIATVPRLLGWAKDRTRTRVEELTELVGLDPEAGRRYPAQLSGGQRQRVALARALVNRPQVLLLDEPLAALDLKLRHAMQVELKQIQREVGITFLFVTHDQDEALSMSDRVAIMNDGVIEQCGRPEDVYENPASIFAAGFIGTSNLMAGTYDGQGVSICPELRIPLVDGHGLAGGDQVSVAIRPEKIWLSELTPAMVQVPATVVSSSYHGATTQYLVEVAAGVTLTVLEQNLPRMSVEGRWTPGSRVQLGWLPEHTVLLR
jgi:spermidine/putrescine transport system ATP-binding protein